LGFLHLSLVALCNCLLEILEKGHQIVHPAPSLCISLLQILEGFFDVLLSFGQFTQGGQNFPPVRAFITSKPRLGEGPGGGGRGGFIKEARRGIERRRSTRRGGRRR
jgi:hypothetical protein